MARHPLVIDRREIMNAKALLALAALLLLSGCAANIRGTVQLVDSRQQPIPNESPKGAVVNMNSSRPRTASRPVSTRWK